MMYQTGAVLYILWGLLHLFAAFQVFKLGSRLEPGMVQGRIYQNALNLACFAIFVIVIAVVYILMPGYLPLRPGILGPTL